ncbi:MAG: hypothetical protein OEV64_06970 [Desulfobulbaceae bacterium]|nr:hypothetical protein [Desulfobulbaceae bacterium]
MKILHLVKSPGDVLAYETADNQRRSGLDEVWILLLHDAVYTPPPSWDKLYISRDDILARGVNTPGIQVDHGEIVDLLFAADTVVNW